MLYCDGMGQNTQYLQGMSIVTVNEEIHKKYVMDTPDINLIYCKSFSPTLKQEKEVTYYLAFFSE